MVIYLKLGFQNICTVALKVNLKLNFSFCLFSAAHCACTLSNVSIANKSHNHRKEINQVENDAPMFCSNLWKNVSTICLCTVNGDLFSYGAIFNRTLFRSP